MKQTTSGSLSEHAYRVIRAKVLNGEYPLGATLSRRVLAVELGMSLLPVSEALQRLEGDGLVESRPRVGTRVRIPSTEDVRGHYVVREALETQVARLFASKATPKECEEVRQMAVVLDDLYADHASRKPTAEELNRVHHEHMAFHRRIAECTGCRPLCDALEKNQVLVFNWLYDVAFERRKLPSHWHAQLAEALTAQNVSAADKAMRRHVQFGMEEILNQLEFNTSHNVWRMRRVAMAK